MAAPCAYAPNADSTRHQTLCTKALLVTNVAEWYNRPVEFRILGPIEVVDAEGRAVAAGGGKQRALLAYLLLHANEVVSRDRLIDELWGESPPPTVESMLHLYLSRVRKLLATAESSAELLTRPPGYVLEVDPSSLDAERFRRLMSMGHDALRAGKAEEAASMLDEALALWRGPALADLTDAAWARSEAAGLEELRLEAIRSKLEAELELGKHALVVAELEELVARHPMHERLRALLMLALYRAGRQAEALEVYQRGRRELVEELGLEPGEELRELERAILRQDPGLAAPAALPTNVTEPAPAAAGDEDRRLGVRALAIGVALVLLAAAAVGFAVNRDVSAPAAVAGNSVAVIDPETDTVAASIAVGARPAAIASAADTVWVSNLDDSSVSRIDASAQKVVRTIALEHPANALVADGKGVWTTADGARLYRVDGGFNAVTRTIALRRRGRVFNVEPVPGAARGGGSLWAVSGTGVVRISARTGKALATFETGDDPTAVAFGANAAWVTDAVNNTVTRVDRTGAVQKLTAGARPIAVSVGFGAVWVANALGDTVVRLDPATRSVEATISVGRAPSGIAIGKDAVWVANSGDGTVSRIDPTTNQVARTIEVGGSPAGIAMSRGAVWVTVQEQLPLTRSGGSALVLLRDDPGGLDPAIAFWDWSWQVLHATCVKLMNYSDRPAPAGSVLMPEAAEAPPTIKDGGRTYVFRVPPRFRFSPPSAGEKVTAQTFRAAIERATSPRTKSESAAWFVRDIVGMAPYRAGTARHLSGVTVQGDRLTVRLTRPSFDLTSRLAMPFFCSVPKRTPIDPRGVRVIPSAGPYYVASYVPGRRLVLRQNPSYEGSRPRNLERIVYAIGGSHRDRMGDIERGRADYAADGLSATDAEQLQDEPTARLYLTPTRLVRYFALNARRPLFGDVRMRQALNYAIDRGALTRLVAATSVGEPGGWIPTDQYLSPAVTGFREADVYPLSRPDVATARHLARGRRATAILYTCDTPPCPEEAQILRRNLSAIGIRLKVERFPLARLYDELSKPEAPFDIGHYAWIPDYPDPENVLNTLFHSGSDWYPGGFGAPYWDRRLNASSRLSQPQRFRDYGRLDVELARDAAPAAAIGYHVRYDFFSDRVGCQVAHPVYGIDLAALCLRSP